MIHCWLPLCNMTNTFFIHKFKLWTCHFEKFLFHGFCQLYSHIACVASHTKSRLIGCTRVKEHEMIESIFFELRDVITTLEVKRISWLKNNKSGKWYSGMLKKHFKLALLISIYKKGTNCKRNFSKEPSIVSTTIQWPVVAWGEKKNQKKR